MAGHDDITPIRKQYLEIKRQYPNAILFFRLGDFYETFDQDAETAARELDLFLTSRPIAKGTRVPMAGIPHHAAENYLARLIEKGFHVAICEQVGDQPTKGIFPRKVVRVVTPGTLVEPGLLPGEGNNYLASIVVHDEQAGVAYVDITTGEFAATELNGSDIQGLLRAELSRLRPAEILHPEGQVLSNGLPGHTTAWKDWHFEATRCDEALRRHFGVTALDGFGLRGMTSAIRAAGAILQYLTETQPAALKLLTGFSTYHISEFMTLDAATRRNLELTETIRGGAVRGSLLGELDQAVTPMGKRLLRQWVSKPLLNVDEIRQRQHGVTFFFTRGLKRAELRAALKPLNDLERLAMRVAGGSAQPRDLVAMRQTLARLSGIAGILQDAGLSLEGSSVETTTGLDDVLREFNLCGEELALPAWFLC